jgi:Uncharacterised protein family (UPF0158)
MEPRRVPVDWDALELALTMHSGEWASYLDVRTGAVHMWRTDTFGAEREDEDLSEEEVEAGLAEGTLIPVEPLESSVEFEWMAEFADTVAGPRLRPSLQTVLGGSRPFRRFKDALADDPRERERWFAFQAERLREAMREWLADNDIEPTTVPPTRSGGS